MAKPPRPAGAPPAVTLTRGEFERVRALALRLAGLSMSEAKKALVVGRWSRRLYHYGFTSFSQYLDLLARDDQRAELQIAIDLLTTNETSWFRERQHFDYLRREVLPKIPRGAGFRVWSAACSTGEEPYSIAMLLADELGERDWEVFASDISTSVLETARSGLYSLDRAGAIPQEYLHRYCLKGAGPQTGRFLIERSLRERVRFAHINLNEPLRDVGQFDVIFLRNVMIYFNAATKAQVVSRLLGTLKPGGRFIVGRCETLNGVTDRLSMLDASVYARSS
ncbi:MAG TPA: CheR family methyltransferase [Steroidobacter sp.]|jgi:chemotaxis protein methyltransferase CheR|nr:CheR family methyltransferase [Steroidobacteraceae bacterium]HLS81953.1 CheR family methyltransferase [Steroidobacter sp.]